MQYDILDYMWCMHLFYYQGIQKKNVMLARETNKQQNYFWMNNVCAQ